MLCASGAFQGSEVDAKPPARLEYACPFGGIDQKMACREEVTAIRNDIVKRLVEGYAPQKVTLFGSYARGEAGEDSDIDLNGYTDSIAYHIQQAIEKCLKGYERAKASSRA